MQSNSLIRGEGKLKGNIKKRNFYSFYLKHHKEKLVDSSDYNSFLKELLINFSEAIITEGLELKIPTLGKIRIKSEKLHIVRKDGTLSKSLRPDWKKTWDYWFTKYEGLTKEEIVAIEGKKVIFHDNDHTDGEFYQHYWDKHRVIVQNADCYKFTASRQYSRLLAQTVKDKNRKVFYYG